VLRGEIRLVVDDDQIVDLALGDAAYYPSSLSHAYQNIGDVEAELFTISAPPKLL